MRSSFSVRNEQELLSACKLLIEHSWSQHLHILTHSGKFKIVFHVEKKSEVGSYIGGYVAILRPGDEAKHSITSMPISFTLITALSSLRCHIYLYL